MPEAAEPSLPRMEKARVNDKVHRCCDLVMRGGVTSGVVYPSAIQEIAKEFYLVGIGGTSAGAIAACAAVGLIMLSSKTATAITDVRFMVRGQSRDVRSARWLDLRDRSGAQMTRLRHTGKRLDRRR